MLFLGTSYHAKEPQQNIQVCSAERLWSDNSRAVTSTSELHICNIFLGAVLSIPNMSFSSRVLSRTTERQTSHGRLCIRFVHSVVNRSMRLIWQLQLPDLTAQSAVMCVCRLLVGGRSGRQAADCSKGDVVGPLRPGSPAPAFPQHPPQALHSTCCSCC